MIATPETRDAASDASPDVENVKASDGRRKPVVECASTVAMSLAKPEHLSYNAGVMFRLAPFSLFFLALLVPLSATAESLKLWHTYRGTEQKALEQLVERWNVANPDDEVESLALPYDAYTSKLTSAIPRGHGPDVFIAAHERAGDWVRSGLLAEPSTDAAAYHPTTIDALTIDGTTYGVPLAYKSVVLFYDADRVTSVPETTDELIARAKAFTRPDENEFGLAYEATNFYMHGAWLYGFGGKIFDDDGEVVLDHPGNIRSFEFVYDLLNESKVVPEEATAVLVSQLFNTGKAAFVINGPWFIGEIADDVNWKMAPLPIVSETGKPARPFLTVEAAFVSAQSKNPRAKEFAAFLASTESAVVRATVASQPVATLDAYDDPEVAKLEALDIFRRQLDAAVPMPNNPKMRSVWEPANVALRQVLRGALEPSVALKAADKRVDVFTRPAPATASPTPTILVVSLLLFALCIFVFYRTRGTNLWARMKRNYPAYVYLLPAGLSMGVLVVTPFVVGSAISLFAHREGEFTFVGLQNFVSILLSQDFGFTDPLSFWFTLGVTVLWTASNVFLHVAIGLGLALLLRDEFLKLRGIYRVLLIIPWAVPNYITALIWKGMFHKQFGAINGILGWFGVEPVSWFSQFSTAFAANLATNVWLGFPFMMVVTLGALQAIPRDLEEAAEVDGANKWQRFRHVTFPLLRPALVPAIVLGTVWTFNMFNIIYLVSAGEPDGATEILISEAYKWAFSRQEQYGYAAAYAVLIFFVLLAYSFFTGQLKTDD